MQKLKQYKYNIVNVGYNSSDFSSRNKTLNYRMIRFIIVSIMIINNICINYTKPTLATLMLVSGAPFVNILGTLGIQVTQFEYLCLKNFCEKNVFICSLKKSKVIFFLMKSV